MVFEAIIGSFSIGALCAFIVSKIGKKISLIDIPNERSSHTISTPRGGGIGLWIAFIFVGVFFVKEPSAAIILSATGLLGLLGDIFSFSSKVRLTAQFVIAAVAAWLFAGLPDSMLKLAVFLFWIIFITGTANFYNFMDGINGIAGVTGVVGFGLMAFFSYFIAKETDLTLLSIVLSAACLGFLPFNFPKATVFMGDVGSIFLGFVFASFVVKLSKDIGVFLCLIMFLSMFYADSIVTIFYRWKRGEPLMQAHRQHLYQYLSNELGLPHWKVSMLYAVIQLVVGGVSILAYMAGLIYQISLIISFSLLFILCYRYVRSFSPVVLKN